jgi:hypothetical protein
MFYEGWNGSGLDFIGYASSPDGVHWSKYQDNPILGKDRNYPSVIKVGSTYYLYTMDYETNDLFAATGTIDQP